MTGFQIFNVVCAAIFLLIWLTAMWKGQAFVDLPLGPKKLLIAGSIVAFMIGWILYDRIRMGV